MTHVATAHVVELSGATPIFIDVDKETGNIDYEKLAKASKENVIKAIMPVHYLGLPCDMNKIMILQDPQMLWLLRIVPCNGCNI